MLRHASLGPRLPEPDRHRRRVRQGCARARCAAAARFRLCRDRHGDAAAAARQSAPAGVSPRSRSRADQPLGFNSGGLDRCCRASAGARRARPASSGSISASNRDSADALADYIEGVRRGAAVADYLVVNVSSPNTPGLRDLQARDALEALLRELVAAREATQRPAAAAGQDRARSRRARSAPTSPRWRSPPASTASSSSNTTVARPPGSAQSAGARGRRAQRPAAIRAFDRSARATCIG